MTNQMAGVGLLLWGGRDFGLYEFCAFKLWVTGMLRVRPSLLYQQKAAACAQRRWIGNVAAPEQRNIGWGSSRHTLRGTQHQSLCRSNRVHCVRA